MSETFDELDAYFWQVNDDPDSHAPDGAVDLIFMLEDEDWAALEAAWKDRPPGWREECAYVLGEGPPEGIPLLETAIFDLEFEVSVQAALAYAAQVLEMEDRPPVSPHLRERLGLLNDLRDGNKSDELGELLTLLRGH